MAESDTFADGALTVAITGSLAVVGINRPEKRNAINRAIWKSLPIALEEISANRSVKVVVLRGSGDHFASGADIGEFADVFANRREASLYAAEISSALDAMAQLEKPSIAQISGSCVGGGLALAIACDLRLSAGNARFGVTPAKLGLMYSLNDTKRLTDLVGPSTAKDLLFTGRLIDAAAAQSIRLVDELHEEADLENAVCEKACLIAKGSQWSVRKAKKIVGMILNGATTDSDKTREWFVDAIDGVDFAEGYAAFMEKCDAHFPYK